MDGIRKAKLLSTQCRFSAETVTKKRLTGGKINGLLLCAVLIRQGEPTAESPAGGLELWLI